MKKMVLIGGVSGLLLISSCDLFSWLDDTVGAVDTGLSDTELIEGLKQSLVLGAKTAAFTLNDTTGATNALGEITGYFANELVKILLPQDAQNAYETVRLLEGSSAGQALLDLAGIDLDGYREAMILGLNRGAEHAAGLSVDVFTAAITGMSFASARDILFGSDSTGATAYLETTTSAVLTEGFEPIIDGAFSAVTVTAFGMNYTVENLWAEFARKYNTVAAGYHNLETAAAGSNIVAALAASTSLAAISAAGVNSVDSVNTDLVGYATGKALDGLFYMVGKQELKIRRDPLAALQQAADFVTDAIGDLIEKVFTASE